MQCESESVRGNRQLSHTNAHAPLTTNALVSRHVLPSAFVTFIEVFNHRLELVSGQEGESAICVSSAGEIGEW